MTGFRPSGTFIEEDEEAQSLGEHLFNKFASEIIDERTIYNMKNELVNLILDFYPDTKISQINFELTVEASKIKIAALDEFTKTMLHRVRIAMDLRKAGEE